MLRVAGEALGRLLCLSAGELRFEEVQLDERAGVEVPQQRMAQRSKAQRSWVLQLQSEWKLETETAAAAVREWGEAKLQGKPSCEMGHGLWNSSVSEEVLEGAWNVLQQNKRPVM